MRALAKRISCFFAHDWGRWRRETRYSYREIEAAKPPDWVWVTGFKYEGPATQRVMQQWELRRCKRCGLKQEKLTFEG